MEVSNAPREVIDHHYPKKVKRFIVIKHPKRLKET